MMGFRSGGCAIYAPDSDGVAGGRLLDAARRCTGMAPGRYAVEVTITQLEEEQWQMVVAFKERLGAEEEL